MLFFSNSHQGSSIHKGPSLTKECYTCTHRYTYVPMVIQYTHFLHVLLILYTLPKNRHRNCLEKTQSNSSKCYSLLIQFIHNFYHVNNMSQRKIKYQLIESISYLKIHHQNEHKSSINNSIRT